MNAFKTFIDALKKMFSFLISDARTDPRKTIQMEKAELQRALNLFNEKLTAHAVSIERMLRQLDKLTEEEKQKNKEISALLESGNRTDAGVLALELQTIKDRADSISNDLRSSETLFKQSMSARDQMVRKAKDKFDDLSRKLSETEMLESQAEFQEMMSEYNASSKRPMAVLTELEATLDNRARQAKGRVEVSSDSFLEPETTGAAMEQEILMERALEQFEKDQNQNTTEREKEN